jgi:hypothetical protein
MRRWLRRGKVAAMWEGMTLIPGRDCGDCTVCCTVMTINKPEIQKESGVTCRHCKESGCAIYDSRPPVCRAWYCAWRTVEIFDADWRPDRSGVMPYVETEGISTDFDLSTGIGLMLVGHPLKAVRQAWFQDFVVTGIMNSVPLFLSLPGPRGHQAVTTSLNTDEMLEYIRRGLIKDGLEAAVKVLRGCDHEPAVITYSGNDVASDA